MGCARSRDLKYFSTSSFCRRCEASAMLTGSEACGGERNIPVGCGPGDLLEAGGDLELGT